MSISLTTDRLVLRPPTIDDVPALTEFCVSERSQCAGGFAPRANARSNAAAMPGHWQIWGDGLWAETEKGRDTALGKVGPYFPDGRPETEIGWALFDGSEGRGIAFEAAQAAINDARARLGWTEIVHYIARSVVLAERLDPDAPQPKPDKPCVVFRHPTHAKVS